VEDGAATDFRSQHWAGAEASVVALAFEPLDEASAVSMVPRDDAKPMP
jgi:hypothetical protein